MNKEYKLTPQAVGAIMMAVQRGILAASEGKSKEECDISSMILNFKLHETPTGLIVGNPPIVQYDHQEEIQESD